MSLKLTLHHTKEDHIIFPAETNEPFQEIIVDYFVSLVEIMQLFNQFGLAKLDLTNILCP